MNKDTDGGLQPVNQSCDPFFLEFSVTTQNTCDCCPGALAIPGDATFTVTITP